jgi:hypothetical protein
MIFWLTSALAADHRVVRPGETLANIAEDEGLTVEELATRNGLAPTAPLTSGTVLLLPGAQDAVAVVLARFGDVHADRPLGVGDIVPLGTVVCTGRASFATLRLATVDLTHAHDEISLLADTCLTVDATWAAHTRHTSLVSVRTGSVSVRADDGDGTVSVRTTDGVTIGDEGGFRVTVEGAATRTEAVSGGATVVGQGGAVVLPSGTGTRVVAGGAPSAPTPLLAPPALGRPTEGAPLRRPDFAWDATERALGYRIELASDPAFADIVSAEDVGARAWRPDRLFLPGGPVWWRVSAFDRTGFLGVPAEGRLLLPPSELAP